LRAIINEARIASSEPQSCPAICHIMLTDPFMRRINADEENHQHLISLGLNHAVREFLKAPGAKGISPDQIEMWPETHQQLVKTINRGGVFVPSLGEFLPLEPHQISAKHTNEAGEHLISFGGECIRAGKNLIRLSKMGW
jgi:hypothetical protein